MQTLKSDHAELDEILNDLKIKLAKQDMARAFEALDLLWASLAVHIRAENICLFPALLSAPRTNFGVNGAPDFEEAKTAIDQLRSDHNTFMAELGTAMKELRHLMMHPESYSMSDAIADLRRRINFVGDLMQQHNETEENVVYKWPQALLDSESLNLLELGLCAEIENMPPRFARAG